MRYLLILVLIAPILPAAAQRPRAPTREVQKELSPSDSAYAARFRLARSFLGAAQIERAIAILEDLHVERPGDASYYNELKGAYESVKRYDDAIRMVDRWLARNVPGAEPQLLAEKARLRYLSGDEQDARAVWDRVLGRADADERIFRLVYESMMQVRLIDRAILALQRGRAALQRPELFQTELAYLHGLVGDHDLAMEEYLALLQASAQQINYVRARLSQTLQQDGAMKAALPIIRARVAQRPDYRSFRELYAWMLVEGGEFADALDQYRILSRSEEQPGRTLFDFAMQAADMGAYKIAATAFGQVLAEHADIPVAADAQLGLADMQRLQGDRLAESHGPDAARPQYEAAVEACRAFLRLFPANPQTPQVLLRIGDLQQNVFLQHAEAEATLLAVVRDHRGTPAAREARFALGRLAVTRNELEAARLIFELLERDVGSMHPLAGRARYERALIHFYQGELAEAGALLQQIRQKTETDMANDAIALRVLLLGNPGPDSANAAVQQYAAAALLFRQRRIPETVDATERLLGYWGQHPIADDTRHLRATALREAGHMEDALVAFGELPLIHPDSPLADRSLFAFATILDHELGRRDEALSAYSDLLMRFPGSLLVPDVRQRIRILRREGT